MAADNMSVFKKRGFDEMAKLSDDLQLEAFTDRESIIREFCNYVNYAPPGKIIVLKGAPGNGKSILLRYLHRQCTRKIGRNTWTSWDDCPDHEVIQLLKDADSVSPVPTAVIDFEFNATGSERPTDAICGLPMIRQQLSGGFLRFPSFDFEWLLLLKKTKGFAIEPIERFIPWAWDSGELLAALIGCFTKTPLASITAKFLQIYVRPGVDAWWSHHQQAANILRGRLDNMLALDPNELLEDLPATLATDVRESYIHATAAEQLVPSIFLFDNIQVFAAGTEILSEELRFERDEWLRRLILSLDLSKTIIVMTTRGLPYWSEASVCSISTDRFTEVSIDNFTGPQAKQYLSKRELTDETVCTELIEAARVTTDEIHPMLLALCADLIMPGNTLPQEAFVTTTGFHDRAKRTVRRFLRYADPELAEAIKLLSASRSFDKNLYFELSARHNYRGSETKWLHLTQLSFIEQQNGRFALHPLLRRLIADVYPEAVRSAHESILKIYEPEKPAHILDYIYHKYQCSPQDGVAFWFEQLRYAHDTDNYQLSKNLLSLETEIPLELPRDRSMFFRLAGQYNHIAGHHKIARSLYAVVIGLLPTDDTMSSAAEILERAEVYIELANTEMELSLYDDATEHYKKSSSLVDALTLAELTQSPSVKSQKILATSLSGLGTASHRRSDHSVAERSYLDAIAVLQNSSSSDVATDILFNLGTTYVQLAGLYHDIGRYQESIDCTNRAISTFEDCNTAGLKRSQFNMGVAFASLGDLYKNISKYQESEKSLTRAQGIFLQFLAERDDSTVRLNLGTAYQKMGELYLELGRLSDAQGQFNKAIEEFERSLHWDKEHVDTLINRASTHAYLGSLEGILNQKDLAMSCFRSAETDLQSAALLAPANHHVPINLAGTLLEKEKVLRTYEEKTAILYVAISELNKALQSAPQDVKGLNFLACCWKTLGDHRTNRGMTSDACEAYVKSLNTFDELIKLAPNYVAALNNRGATKRALAKARQLEGQPDEVVPLLTSAVKDFEKVPASCIDNPAILQCKAICCKDLAEALCRCSLMDIASRYYRESIECCARALKVTPSNFGVLHAKGTLYLSLVQSSVRQPLVAIKHCRVGIGATHAALKVRPDDPNALNLLGILFLYEGELLMQLSHTNHGKACMSFRGAEHSFIKAQALDEDNTLSSSSQEYLNLVRKKLENITQE